jgi:hypothetical protein
MKNFLSRKHFLVVLILALGALQVRGLTRLTPSAKFSVITCSPGPDLYSLFGHSAFRLQDTLGGKPVDIVFNYGVFDAFDDGFYMKFARGKLDYRLQAEYFEYFLESYAQEGRGVWEQELNFSPLQKQRLFELLQANVQEGNCVYRYDFFYDNCSSRIRDMIIRAAAVEPTDAMGFRYVSLDTLLSVNEVSFKHPCKRGTTYREAIQKYLDFQPWSDFGIDIALGQPCDRVIGDYGFMFLPDSLMREFEMAELSGQLVCGRPIEILPNRTQFEIDYLFAPLTVFCVWLIVHAALSYRRRNVKKNLMLHEAILLGVTGLISLLVLFLWFLTDHTTTQYNWNVLWASPINLLLLFLNRKPNFVRLAAFMQLLATIAMLVSFAWLPQSLHVASIPIALMLIITYFRLYQNARNIEHQKSTKEKE